MSSEAFLAVIATAVVVTVCLIAWGLLGPRRPSDESGHHVDLAEQTRQRDLARRAGRDPEGTDTDSDAGG